MQDIGVLRRNKKPTATSVKKILFLGNGGAGVDSTFTCGGLMGRHVL
jgi:hypothetical protein